MKIAVLLGTTMAGKTTHGKMLAMRLGGMYISSGDIARKHMDANTSTEFKEGKLSPHDDLILAEIKGAILELDFTASECEPFIILDGFPRTVAHLSIMEKWISLYLPEVRPLIIALDVPTDVLAGRARSRNRDEFDNVDTIIKRHQVFLETTLPVWKLAKPPVWVKALCKLTEESPVNDVNDTLFDICSMYQQNKLAVERKPSSGEIR